MESSVMTLGRPTQSTEYQEYRDQRLTLTASLGRHYRRRAASESSERSARDDAETTVNSRRLRGRLKSLSEMVSGLRDRLRPSSERRSLARSQEIGEAFGEPGAPEREDASRSPSPHDASLPALPPRDPNMSGHSRPRIQRQPSAPTAPSRPLPPTPGPRSSSLDFDERPWPDTRPRQAQSLMSRSFNRSGSRPSRFSSTFDTSPLARVRPDEDRVTGNVYEDPSALERAFGPMQDVARWYSATLYSSPPEAAASDASQHVCTNAAHRDLQFCSCQRPMPARPAEELSSVYPVPECLTKTANGRLVGRSNRVKHWPAGLTSCLRELASHGWYWGPISRMEAENLVAGRPDGTFLVRDSSDDRYLLSLTFRSQGNTLHTRVEHFQGYFSFYQNPSSAGRANTIAELIEKCMHQSRGGAFCYSRIVNGTSSAIPVRLVLPHSRFRCLRTLQQQCRFVIRQHTRYDLIQELPISKPMKEFVLQSPFR